MGLKRTNDIGGGDLKAPYYTVAVIIRRVEADNPDGTTVGEKVIREDKRLDTDLVGVNAVLEMAGLKVITEKPAE